MKHCPHAVPDCHVCKPHIQRFSELEEMNAGLRALNHELLEFLQLWTHDGCLQTFEHREKFRADARALIARARGDA